MAQNYLVESDIDFVKELKEYGADTLKKCYQCATCSVVCPISPDNRPFPRKEMIAASWGLKDKLVSNVDIWLCHQCGDCSVKCPRGARPGDVLGAVRLHAIAHYARPKWLAKAVRDPKMLPWLILFPAAVFLVMGLVVGPLVWKLVAPVLNLVIHSETPLSQAVKLLDFTPDLDAHGRIAHGMFFSSWLVDMIFIPAAIWAVVVFVLAIRDFVTEMHASSVREGKVKIRELNWVELAKALPRVILPILRHDKAKECTENKDRATAHMMVLFAFIGLFVVTLIFLAVLWGSMLVLGYEHAWHSPYSQLNPVKWLANVAGIALLVGALAMIKNRLSKDESVAKSSYQDWFLIVLVLALAVTGLGAQMTRLGGAATLTYWTYFVHLMAVFALFVYLPFTKLAHLVYRTVALTYAEYAGREN